LSGFSAYRIIRIALPILSVHGVKTCRLSQRGRLRVLQVLQDFGGEAVDYPR
jgi:hypothetical protein